MSPRLVNEQQYDSLLRQSRLAEPPLVGVSHLPPDELAKKLASYAPPISLDRQALILAPVTATISILCKKLDDKLHDTRPFGLGDSEWFGDLFFHLSRRLDEMNKSTELKKETYARAIDAKFRGDVEDQIRGKAAHVRTIGGFIVQTLRELLDMLEKGEQVPHDFLWKDVVSLEHIDLDMLAWVAYCSNPKGAGWQGLLRRREPGVAVSNRRIALHRGFSLQHSSKPEFQVESRQDSGFSTHYDDLLKAHPSGYH